MGHHGMFEKYSLTAALAAVVGELFRTIGVCLSKEILISALRGADLKQ